MKRIKYLFWMWVHDRLERAWHWVYRNGVAPNCPPFPTFGVEEYDPETGCWPSGTEIVFMNDEVTVYRY